MVYLITGGFWLSGSQFLITVVSFFSTVAFGYYLPKSGYGDYKYILSVFSILSAFTLSGLYTAIVQSVARGYEGSLKQGFLLNARWSFVAIFGALSGSVYYFWRDNQFLGISLLLIAISLPFFHSLGLYSSFINGKKDFRRLSLYSVFDNIIPLATVVCTLFFTQNVLLILTAYFFSNIFIRLYFYSRTNKLYGPNNKEDPDLASYGLKLSLLNIIGIVTTHIDKVIVYTYLGSVELAIYGFASAFPDRIRAFLKNLSTLMIPKFTEHDTNNSKVAIRRKTLQLFILVLTITIVYLQLAPFLYNLFFPKYPESVLFSQILSLSIISALAMIPSSLFIAQKREGEIAKATIYGSIFQIITLLPAIHFGGLTGVCVARVLSSYIILAISYFMLRRKTL
ncbi:MAG: Polysaccharide biosynthesis protein [Parcubacteria group bacterium GW2011_GWA2_43_11]|nr:MAG: Polysaccharide biosynthesis protein [Parcubacteria group bacterium GW2011_GWA2_43_11]